jgi:2-desacetyl-2-hydroxyethyl bacteriochlorophyllide A dehydrogenase
MRASSYGGAGRFTTVDVPVPKPGAGEALLRVRRVGICGTDLHIFQGHLDHRVPKGGVIGHETLKVRGVDVSGGMQEYWAVPVTQMLHVPDTLTDDQAAVLEPLAVATHDVDRAAVKRGDRVLVFGGGPIGALIAMVARGRGAEVAVVEINPYRIGLLEEFGLTTVGPDIDVHRFVETFTGGAGVDIAFEVTGNPAAARVVTDVVRVWGTVSIVAIHSEPIPINLYRMFERELTIQGARLYARRDWEEAIHLAASGTVPLAPLVTRTIPLDSLPQGMEQALAGGPVMKILVDVTR